MTEERKLSGPQISLLQRIKDQGGKAALNGRFRISVEALARAGYVRYRVEPPRNLSSTSLGTYIVELTGRSPP